MKKLVALFAINLMLINISSQLYNEIDKVLLRESTPGSYLGFSVAVDGDYAVIGAYQGNENKGVAYVYYYNGSDWEQKAKLTASDGANGDRFGWAVSISNTSIVVSAYRDDDNGTDSGSAYVFTKSGSNWVTMTETAKLTASDGLNSDYFGKSVSISGNNIVVGTYGDDDNGSSSGSAYIFTKSGSNWVTMTETAKLTASDGASYDNFGYSVSISGDNIVVGASQDDDNGGNSGSAYVFTKPGANWVNMTETAKIRASDAVGGDFFGFSVSISGNSIVVGAYYNDGNGSSSGSAYVFTKSGSNWVTMTETAKLTASDGSGGDKFGYSVSISGDQIVVGASSDDDNGSNSGSAYVFTKSGSNWVTMIETAKLTPSDGAASDFFGFSVCVSGNHIISGAYQDDDNGSNSGSFYTFYKPISGWVTAQENQKINGCWNGNDYLGYSISIDGDYSVVGIPGYNMQGIAAVYFFDGSSWLLQAKLTASDGANGDEFGKSVSISGDNIVVGAYKNDVDGNIDEGAAYVFIKPGGGWTNMTQTAKLTSSVGAAEDYFGRSVSIDGNNIVVGAYYVDLGATNEGSAYVFTKPGANWTNMTQTAKLTSSVGADDDYFGISVSISGDNIVVGAYKDDFGGNTNEGSAYVFTKSGANWTTMTETAKLTSSVGAADDNFGISVAIDGDDVVVGAYRDDIGGNSNEGSAYVFSKPGGGWVDMTQTAKLTSSVGATNDYMGRAVSIDGDQIAIGAYGDDISSVSTGSAYVFTKPVTGWVSMNQTQKITASDGEDNDQFGFSIGISGDYLAIGARFENLTNAGAAYLYKHCTPLSSTISPVVCDSYTSPSGNYTWTTSGNYSDTLNVYGCDSIITINLTVSHTPPAPSAPSVAVCSGEDVTIVATNTSVFTSWYDEMIGGNLISSSDTLTRLNVTAADTFYVQTSVGLTSSVGALDNLIGVGSNFTSFTNRLEFDANSIFSLDSVTVYPNGAGDVVVNLLDNNSVILQTVTVPVSGSGATRIPVGFTIPAGTGYRLNAVGTTTGGLYRNNGGVSYPYTDGNTGQVSITGSSSGGSYYYFFYDWKISVESCPSDRVASVFKIKEFTNDISSNNISCNGGNDGSVSIVNFETLFFEGFEDYSGANTITSGDSLLGVTNWEYTQSGSNGRLRIPAGPDYVHSGNKSATLDVFNSGNYITNYLMKTVDLSAYGNIDSLWLSFWFMNHGDEQELEDRVWVRGSDTDAWIEVFDWQSYSPINGQWYFKELELMTVLNGSGQSLSATFQIRFGQRDNYPSSNISSSDGLTIDDIILKKEWENSISYLWNTGDTTNSITNLTGGTYYVDVADSAGCMASDTIIITEPAQIDSLQNLTSCDSLNVNGTMYFTSQTIMDTLTAANGCDSIVTTQLTINYSDYVIDTQIACDSLTWIDGVTYYASNNTATYTLTNAAGCDSVVTLDLTILNSSSSVDVLSSCDSLTWMDGVTYYASNNTAIYTLTNAAGCDSIITLDLTILNSSSSVDVLSSCDSLTWMDGVTYYVSNNTATYILTNSIGCDSIITLDLTILNSSSSIDVLSSCDSLTWMDGITYYTSNNTATYTLTNGSGCDSVISLDLTITTIDNSVTVTDPTITANLSGASYQWLDCENGFSPVIGETFQIFTATDNGEYAVELTFNSCIDTSECVQITSVFIESEEGLSTIRVYPNPTKGEVTVDLGNRNDVSIKVFTTEGRLVYHQEHINSIVHQFILNKAKGIYIVEINDQEETKQFILVKK